MPDSNQVQGRSGKAKNIQERESDFHAIGLERRKVAADALLLQLLPFGRVREQTRTLWFRIERKGEKERKI